MILETPERQHAASCDICGLILDPGAADAPMGGYPTREAAQKAADAHDWFKFILRLQLLRILLLISRY